MVPTKQRQARPPSLLPVGGGIRKPIREEVNLGLLALWLASSGVPGFSVFCFIGVITVLLRQGWGVSAKRYSSHWTVSRSRLYTSSRSVLLYGRTRVFGAKSRAEDD